MTSRFRVLLLVALVLVLGALLRVVVFDQSRDWIVLTMPVLDAGYYDAEARSILEGSGNDEPYFMGPLYPYVVALAYEALGARVSSIRIVHMVLGLLGAGLVARVASRVFGGTAPPVTAALLAVLYGPWLFFEQLPLMAALLATASVAFVELTLWWRARGGALGGIVSGLLVGALTALRGTGLLYVVPLLVAVRGRVAALPRVLAFVGIAAVILPFAWHNRQAGSDALLSTNLGWNLFVAVGPQANGMFVYPNGWRAGDDVTGRALASERAGRELTADEANRYWMGRAWASVREDPLRVAVLAAKKVWLVLQAGEIPQNENERFFRVHTPAARLAFVGWWILLPLAVLGLFAPARDPVARRVVLLTALVPIVVCVVFFVTSRYRLPAVPPLIVLASGGVAWLLSLVHEGRARDLARRGVPVLVSMGALFALSILLPPVNPDRALSREYEHLGLRYQSMEAYRSAIEAYETAISIHPRNGDALNNLGTAWLALEELPEAERFFRRATEVVPRNPVPWVNLGMLLGRMSRDAEAEVCFRRAHDIDPTNVATVVHLGTSLALQNKLEEAALTFELALDLDPTNGVAREYLLAVRDLQRLPSERRADP